MRSLTELAGLEDSNFATISATHPGPVTLFNFTSGVFPINSNTLFAIFGLVVGGLAVAELKTADDDDEGS